MDSSLHWGRRAWGPGYVEEWGSENRREAMPLGQEVQMSAWLQEVKRVNSWSFLFSLWTRRCLQERIERIEKATRANMLLLLLLSHFSCVRILATPWTAAYQAPLSMGFSRQEYWSGVPLPSPTRENMSQLIIEKRPLGSGRAHLLGKACVRT